MVTKSAIFEDIKSMRKMIAEINHVYKPSLILLDGIEIFVDGGHDKGTNFLM